MPEMGMEISMISLSTVQFQAANCAELRRFSGTFSGEWECRGLAGGAGVRLIIDRKRPELSIMSSITGIYQHISGQDVHTCSIAFP